MLSMAFLKQTGTTFFITHYKYYTMGNLLYIIAVILVIAWVIGFVGYSAGGLIHILLVIAVIVVLLRVIQGKSPL